ncbi:Fic family protein [Achromobacter aloeverae]|uniref:Fic family protein n=1 Tax=Achromobacter aloeverae TaxID=1750518 RepID=UPI001F013AF3|nr:Fic family protein [Achromobacter aloeverae]
MFKSMGFRWDRARVPEDGPAHEIRRTTFRLHKMLAEYVWDASVLEGNPFTFPQVQTVLSGITVGGHKLSDQDQVRNLAACTRELLRRVKNGTFAMDKRTCNDLHAKVAKEEAAEWGHLRGEGAEQHYTPHVGLGAAGSCKPSETQPGAANLNAIFANGINELSKVANPFERGMAFFLFGALQQFFFDGNKRTSRMMMNGIFMSHGIDAISVPAGRAEEFNEKMVRFYVDRDATEMMHFLVSCHPDSSALAAY